MAWKEVNKAQLDHLKRDFTVVKTKTTDLSSSVYKRMYKWCLKNVNNRWGVGQLEEYDNFITFRFWQDPDAEEFCKKFKKHIEYSKIGLSK